MDKTIKIKPMSEIIARYYNLKFKQDNDFYNEDYRKKYSEGYGDVIYDNGLEFAKDNETVEIIFANSVLYQATGTDKVYPAIYKKSNENTKEDPMDHVIRIFQIKKITGVASWNILNNATVLTSLTKYLYCGHIDSPSNATKDISFGAPKQVYFNLTSGDLSNNLFNNYYSPYIFEITNKDSRLFTAYFDLKELDIFNLDFSKYIFIDGGLYRINKVLDYAPGSNELTKVELLRVIDAYVKQNPPTIGDSFQGGKVAYILQEGDAGYDANYTKGFIVSNTDLTPAIWGCQGTNISGAEGAAVGTGQQNTTDILAGCATAGIAARVCDAYSNDGYSDWYLPSIGELGKIYENRVAIGFSYSLDYTSLYWSSTEYTSSTSFLATVRSLAYGTGGGYGKNTVANVRAIRNFTI